MTKDEIIEKAVQQLIELNKVEGLLLFAYIRNAIGVYQNNPIIKENLFYNKEAETSVDGWWCIRTEDIAKFTLNNHIFTSLDEIKERLSNYEIQMGKGGQLIVLDYCTIDLSDLVDLPGKIRKRAIKLNE